VQRGKPNRTNPQRHCGKLLLALCLSAAAIARAERPPPPLPQANLSEHLGTRIDLDLSFSDQRGNAVKLGQYFDGRTPVLLTLNYFHCRTLCDVQLARLVLNLETLASTIRWNVRALTVSIDPRDTVRAARDKRAELAPGNRAGLDWTLLVGTAENVLSLATALGASYAYDARSGQYAHVPATFVLAPDGRVVRYLYGVDTTSSDFRLAVLEASAGRIGTTTDKLLLRCFAYDPSSGRYSLYVLGVTRASSVLLLIAMIVGFVRYWRRERAMREPKEPR
jgi:protein SCO1/2